MPTTPNALQQWMDWYKHNVFLGSLGSEASNSDPNMDALSFAQRMTGSGNGMGGMGGGQPMPDYFSDKPSGNPLAGNGVGAGPMAPQQGYNRLAQMLGRRY